MRNLVSLLVLVGCASPPGGLRVDSGILLDYPTGDTPYVTPPTACAVGLMFVRGGMGATSFTALEPGDVASIYHNPGGGWELQTAVDVANSSGHVQILTTVTLLATGQVISGVQGAKDANNMFVNVVPTGGCRGEVWDVGAMLNDFTPGEQYDSGRATFDDICAIYGQSARIAWTVTDLIDFRVAETSVEVVIAPDPLEYWECAPLPEDTGEPEPY